MQTLYLAELIMTSHYVQALPTAETAGVNRALLFDRVNDNCVSTNSPFYSFGTGPFVFAFKCFLFTNNTNYQQIVTKGAGNNLAGFRISGGDMVNDYGNAIYFFFPQTGTLRFTFQNPVDIRNRPATMVIQRTGNNDAPSSDALNWPKSNRNPDNYELFVDGIKTNWKTKPAELPSSNFDNDGNFYIGTLQGGNQANRFGGFISDLGVYSGTYWTQDDVNNFQAGEFSADGAKGIWPFNEVAGNLALDVSSVQENLLLENYTDLDLGIPDPNTNAARFPTDGIFHFPASTTKKITYTATRVIGIKYIFRYGSTTIGSLTYKLIRANGAVQEGNFPAFVSQRSTMSIALDAGDILEITATNGLTAGILAIMY